MRMWYGREVEYNPNFGKMTLFVEAESPNIDTILEILSNLNVGIDCIYFGAGEVNVSDWTFLKSLYKISDAFIVELETSDYLPAHIIRYFDHVIFRIYIPCVTDTVSIKYRASTEVGVSKLSNFNKTSLLTLNCGQFDTDVEVYKEE